jgi:hypothetical protein
VISGSCANSGAALIPGSSTAPKNGLVGGFRGDGDLLFMWLWNVPSVRLGALNHSGAASPRQRVGRYDAKWLWQIHGVSFRESHLPGGAPVSPLIRIISLTDE